MSYKFNTLDGNVLHLFNKKGEFVKSFYRIDERVNQLNLKSRHFCAMRMGNDNNIYAIQSVNHKISVFNKNLKLIRTFGQKTPHYREPGYLKDEIKKDKRKMAEFDRNFTYIMDIFELNGKVIILSRNTAVQNT